MADRSQIEWTDATFNPWIGCTKVSPACDHCYAAVSTPARTLGIEWGTGQPRRRTSDGNWKMPLQWNRRDFFECRCGKRGEWSWFGANHADCPLRPARRRVFCASLADVFDNEVSVEWRRDLFQLIIDTPNLDWLLLTKRIGNAERMMEDAGAFSGGRYSVGDGHRHPLPNVWLGATVCNQAEADRDIPKLLATPACVRFLSMEPILGPVNLWPSAFLPCHRAEHMRMDQTTGAYECCKECDFTGIGDEVGIDWVIAGGESGHGARPMHPDWARSLRDQCAAARVPFLFKQWGEWLPDDHAAALAFTSDDDLNRNEGAIRVGKKAAGRHLDGVLHDAYPNSLEKAA